MADAAPGADFTDEQKRYLEGFASGLNVGRAAQQLNAGRLPAAAPPLPNPPLGEGKGGGPAEPIGPDAAHIKAQDRVLAEGKKLSDQEKEIDTLTARQKKLMTDEFAARKKYEDYLANISD